MPQTPNDEEPLVGSFLEVELDDGRKYRLIVERRHQDGFVLAAPRGVEYPDLMSQQVPITVGWAGERSWVAARASHLHLVDGASPRWRVADIGEPRRVNRRRFMRGGGGEPIRIGAVSPNDGQPLVKGRVIDLSEGGVRCAVPELGRAPGDSASLAIFVEDRKIETVGIVYDLREPKDRLGLDAILVYGLPENLAQQVRQYLFKRQLEARRAQRMVRG